MLVPDPPSRFEIRTQVDAVVSGGPAAEESRRALAQRFQSWQEAIPALTELVARSPRMPDAQVRVTQLEQLAEGWDGGAWVSAVGAEASCGLERGAAADHC